MKKADVRIGSKNRLEKCFDFYNFGNDGVSYFDERCRDWYAEKLLRHVFNI